jgi:hypothetical protein
MFSQILKNGLPISMDLVVVVGLFIIFFSYAMYFGKSRIISAILAFYPAQFLYEHFPFLNKFLILKGDTLLTLNKVLIFLIFFVLLNIMIARYIFSESGYGSSKIFRVSGLAAAAVIVVMVFTYSVISLDSLYNFSGATDVLFFGTDKIFYWNLAPLGLLFFL